MSGVGLDPSTSGIDLAFGATTDAVAIDAGPRVDALHPRDSARAADGRVAPDAALRLPDATQPDAAQPDVAQPDAAQPVTCAALYGGVPGYRGCGEPGGACRFYFNAGTGTADCASLCGAANGTCLGSAMEDSNSCKAEQATPCSYAHHDGICLCTRGVAAP